MKLPKSSDYPKFINVNDEKYSVRLVKRIPGEDKSCCGQCDDGRKIIWIRSSQSPLGLFRTLIHELLHAVEAEHSIKLKHSLVYDLEVALTALVMDNL
jgi:hypothetical protein